MKFWFFIIIKFEDISYMFFWVFNKKKLKFDRFAQSSDRLQKKCLYVEVIKL